ncbi:MAG: metal ABC transporter substrate-binding protein [bacterium]
MRKIFTCFVILLLAFTACTERESTKTIITSSIEPISFIVKFILSGKGESISLLGENQDAHSSEIKALSMKAIEKSSVIILLGSRIEFEEKSIGWITENAKNSHLVFLFDTTAPRSDPHAWISLSNLKMISDSICGILSAYDETNRSFYSANSAIYNSRVDSIEQRLKKSFAEKNIKKIFTDHTAFYYFASEMTISQTEIFDEGKEPSLSDMAEIIDSLKADSFGLLFITSTGSMKYAEVLEKEANAKIFKFNPLAPDIAGEFEKLAIFLEKK